MPDHHQSDIPVRGPASMMGVVLERSRRLCLSQYQKELFTPTSYLDAYARMQDRLTRQQLAVFAGWAQQFSHIARGLNHLTTLCSVLLDCEGMMRENSHLVTFAFCACILSTSMCRTLVVH